MSRNKHKPLEDDVELGVNEKYMNNARLPKPGLKTKWTKERIELFAKAKKDIRFFAQMFFWIVTVDDGKQNINLYPAQKRILNTLAKNRFVITCSCRQAGKTTLLSVYALWMSCFEADKRIVIVANKLSTATMILKRIKLAYEQLPNWLKPGLATWAQTEVSFENNSSIAISTTTGSAVRGESVNLLIIDEMAHIESHIMEEFWGSVIPVISSTRKGTTKIFAFSCVTDDTFVFTKNGIKQIKDFIDYDKTSGYEIPKYEVLGYKHTRTGNLFYNNGLADIRKIKSSSSWLNMSTTHKIWACKNGNYDWYKASELEIGDFISIHYGHELWGNNDFIGDFTVLKNPNRKNTPLLTDYINKDLAYFIGLFIAEGSTYIKRNEKGEMIESLITLSCGDDISNAIQNIGLSYSKSSDSIHYTISSVQLVEFLEYIGFDLSLKAKNKVIPSRLLEMSRDNIIAMLQGIFDGDGCCDKNRGRVSFISSSKVLTEQIRIILNNFGILTDFSIKETLPTKKVKVSSIGYRLSCNSKYSRIFLEKIGFRFKRKQENIKYIQRKSFRNTKDVIPFSKNIIKTGILKRGTKRRLINEHNIYFSKLLYTDNTEHASRDTVLKLKSYLKKDEISNELCCLLEETNENIKWEQITSIETDKKEVFDFSLPEIKYDEWCHSVLYNNILGHQTPKGTGNLFHKIYSDAEAGKTSEEGMKWATERIDWWEVPGRGKKWKADMMGALGGDEQLFAQEFENCFLETGESAIDSQLIEHFKRISRPPSITFEDSHYKVWIEPQENHIYGIGVDVAEGIGKAASVAQILDFTDLTNIQQAGTYHNNAIHPLQFAEVLNRIGQHWGTCPILIERNACGGEVIGSLQEKHQYNNIVSYNPSENNRGIKDHRLGILSHTNTKYSGVMNMRYWLNSLRVVNIYDIGTINELQTFVKYPNGTWKAKAGNNVFDDRVLALVWALFLIHEDICEQYYDIVDIDDNGKPLKIRNFELQGPTIFGLDPFFQNDKSAPIPTIFGFNPSMGTINGHLGQRELMEQGWRPIK